MTEETKKTIDEMDYESMLRMWRHAPCGHSMFQGDTGDYFKKVMAEKKKEVGQKAHVTASKTISWALLFTMLLIAGCGSWLGSKHLQELKYIDGKMRIVSNTHIKARQFQCLTDTSRTDMNFTIKGLGTASMGTSCIDAESLADIIKSLPLPTQAKLFELLGVK